MKPALIACLLAAATATVATPALGARRTAGGPPPAPAPAPAPSPPITKDGIEINILPQVASGSSAAGVTQIGLDLEATTPDAATRFGFRSLRAVADVDCGKSSNRFVSAEAFDQPALAGTSRPRAVTGQWVQPTADSYMAAVIARVCTVQAAAPAAHAPPAVRAMASAPPPVAAPQPPPQPASQAAATPTAAAPAAAQPAATPPTTPLVVKFSGGQPVASPPVAAAPTSPAPAAATPPPTPPLVVKFSGGQPVASPPVAAAPTAPAPAPAATPAPAPVTAPSGPLVVKFSGAAPARAAPSAAAPKRAGDRMAQVASSPNIQDAEKVLRELKPLIVPPLTTTIEQATVGGAHVYRADVVGFETAADAKAFCNSAAHVSKTCWVRAEHDMPAKSAKPAERLRPAKPAG